MATKAELGQALQAAHEAGDDESAAKLAAAYAAAPDDAPMSVGDIASGVGDIALQGLRGTAHQLAGTAFGVGSMIRGEPYMAGKKLYSDIASGEVVDPENPDPLGVKPAGKLTAEGERVAKFIAGLPLPGVSKGGKNITLGEIGEGISNVGKWIDKTAGPEAGDVARSVATLYTLRGGQIKETATEAAKAISDMRNAGYITTPTAPIGGGKYAGSGTERKLAGLVDADPLIAVKNQELTDKFGAVAGDLPEKTTTPGGVEKATQQATADYEAIKNVKAPIKLQADAEFIKGIMGLGKRVIGSGEPVDDAIARMGTRLLGSNMDVAGVVDRIGELRKSGYTNINKATTDEARRLGLAQREAADVLEGTLDRFLQRAAARNPGSPVGSLYNNWVKARQRLSTLHIIRDSMNETTGTLDAAKVAKEATERGMDNIHPALRVIARAYQANPDALRNVSKAAKRGSSASLSLVGSSVAGGVIGGSLGLGPVGYAIGALAPIVSRELARQYIARGKQARLLQSAAGQVNRNIARGTALGEQVDTDEQP